MKPVWNLTWIDDETCRAVFESPDSISIKFSRISETIRADAVTAIIYIETDIAAIGRVYGPARLNLLSGSSVDGVRRACQNITDIPDWARVLGDAIAGVLSDFGAPEGTDIDLDATWEPAGWLLRPLLESEGYTVIYARGGSGKSYLACALCASVASGAPLLGFEPERTGPVAYLDWEASTREFGNRLQKVCRGAGIGTLDHRVRHYRMFGPFAARRASMGPELAQLDPALVVIDSKGHATTGAPESSEGIMDLARALRYIKAPVLLIDHISKGAIKGDDPDMAFGSQYVEASARLAWSVKTEYKPGSMILHMRNTKANNHARSDPLAFELLFAGDEVAILSTNPAQPPDADLPKHAPAIIDWLTLHGPARQSDIAKALDIHPTQVKRVLTETPGFVQDGESWSVFTPPPEIPY